jgi:hypothetical protein
MSPKSENRSQYAGKLLFDIASKTPLLLALRVRMERLDRGIGGQNLYTKAKPRPCFKHIYASTK